MKRTAVEPVPASNRYSRAFVALLAWLAPVSVYPDRALRRRAQVFGAVGAVLFFIGLLRAVVFAASGAPGPAIALLVASFAGVVYATSAHVGYRPNVMPHVFAVQMSVYLVSMAIYRGGIGATVLGVFSVLVVMMTFVAGRWAGLLWWGVSLAAVLLLASVEGAGLVTWPDAMGDDGYLTDAVSAMIIPTAALVVAMAFEWSRELSEDALRRATRDRSEAEHRVAMAKSEKMASIGVLAAGVGHEINNPLTYVGANIEVVMASLDADRPEHREWLDLLRDAQDGVSRIARIVGDLGDYARSRPDGVREVVDVNTVAKTALRMTRHELEHRARLRVDLQPVAPVDAYEGKLVQVVVNFLVNAAHAVEVRTDADVWVRTGQTGGEVWLEVTDNGVGIQPGQLDKIFDPFFTTKAVGKGTGLGLSTSRALVEAVGGRLTVDSVAGEGATFRLTLPVSASRAQDAGRSTPIHLASNLRILIVDDEQMFRALMPRLLQPHEVRFCASASTAMEVLREDAAFDLVLSDVMMYPVAGWELLEHVRHHYPDLAERFVFITGGAFTADAQRRVREAEVPVLGKPFTLAEVEGVARSLAHGGQAVPGRRSREARTA